MKYRDSIEKSAEYLRLALPLMSKQSAALHPVSYAVWYEYVAGNNAALKAGIDGHLQKGAVLDEKTTFDLFRKHVAELDSDVAQRVSEGFQKIMADMSHSASEAGDHADQFGSALAEWSAGLSESEPGAGLETILDLTRNMQGSVTSLKGRLDESRREIEQLRQEVSKAREDALADGLTGLTNRRGFDMALAACLSASASDEQGPSLLITDIDHFKRVNDSYGHLFGDRVIRAVAQILKDNVKGKDTAARYGGEEFVILLPDTPLDGARHLAEKIRAAVEKFRIKRADSNEAVANITVSLGVANYRNGESGSDFVARADAALYASKNQGRNRVTVAGAT
ncbi:MAG: GGDEF domain-containing protein [Rhodocyclaceae bacterium]|jgi:diguanylate cyclase|nr:GGDEF domain-containing protein [Rhodocyclaceae bacterium]